MEPWEDLEDRSARGLAAAVGRAVRDGSLAPGTRLPPVRTIARQLGISPTTVSEAWRELARAGVIETRGRNGTVVRRPDPVQAPRRYRQVTGGRGAVDLDLSTGTPDPALLPDLARAVARVADRWVATASYAEDPVVPALAAVLRDRWPVAPEALTVTDGAMDALDRVLRTLVALGDRVVVEDPTFPPLLDLLEVLGAEVVGVPLDERGMRPEPLADALVAHRPVAVVLQPRAHNPTGASMDARRAAALARVLADHPAAWVVEDDHSGDIASAAPVTLARHVPERTVTVVGFSKSHGPDLRLAAVGGAAGPVEAAATRRQLGPGWSSRLLQAALAHMLTDAVTTATVAAARDTYARRRAALTDALAARGLAVAPGDGINVWVPVLDEQHALVALAARGLAVAPGSPFQVTATAVPSPHVRVTVASLEQVDDDLVDAFVAAAGPPGRPGGA